MKKSRLKLITLVLCLLFSVLTFPKDTFAESTPSAPTDFTAMAESSSEIYLKWDSVSNATYYYVYSSTSSSGTYVRISTTSATHFRDAGLSADTTYYYKVKAVNSAGTSAFSSRENATTLESDESNTLTAPEDLTARVESSSEIYLDWDSVSGATSYYVYRSTSSSGTYSKIDTTTSSRYTDEDLEADTKYYYKVKAVNSSGTSPYSSREYATTLESDESNELDESDTLTAPEDLTARVESSSEIYLDWDSVSDATSYYVYRSTSSSGTYSKIDTTTSSRYTDEDLDADTKYYYKVKAVNSSGTSPYSSREYATTLESDESDKSDTLTAPTNLSAKVESSTKIYLDWDSVSDATSYDIYSATSSSGSYYKIGTTTSSSYRDTNLEADTTYYYKIKAVNNSDSSSYSNKTQATTSDSDSTAPSDPSPQIQYERLAGEDMYDTSAEVAKKWTTSYYAIIVNGDNFADALCSAPLAQKYNAPLLLTKSNVLSAQTLTQLERLKVKKAIIIGGTGIISSEVEKSIKFMGIEVSRISGTDRYDTSIKIAQALGEFNQAVIASGETFPDALSIAPIAAMKGIPVFLTTKDNLPENVKAYLLKNVQSTYVVGGTGVISDNVLMQLPSPKRLSGITRYDTNISIIKEFANELDFGICYVSTGENYADALAGSALASLTNSPVILVRDPVQPSTLAFFRGKNSSIKQKVVFGGTVVVPESILTSINDIEGSDTPSAPTGLKATTVSSSQINLIWDSVSGATSYYVYGSTSASGTYTHIATVTTTIFVNTGLWADTTYYYKVKAVNDAGSSSYSPMDYARTTLTDY
ncbi:cell wall-binding repeat-containing protein [Desulfosporosinus sp.]|uniref:cell wall-binding repeat-containing protein n=1 Tax=Desulfosporosinus sp. TaxID=157907 RepID=UPI0025C4C453|nr:cell wall-binding repeat-containing protein [Desulfosporosinus sp.]MBC2726306.1 cell wall-binding repeat-containing protein [Desulfosporosinus sp.]